MSATQTEWLNPTHPCRGIVNIPDAESGIVDLLMPDGSAPRKKFALCGFASSTRKYMPLNDPEWAVCGMNQLQRHLVHAGSDGKTPVLRHGDLWFEIHKEWNTAVVPGTDHEGWLRDCGIPILMVNRLSQFSTSVRYPVERLIEKFEIDYFTSTVAFMLAFIIDHIDRLVHQRLHGSPTNGLATALDVLELAHTIYGEYTIGVFGIDLVVGEEYTDQRPAAEYWLGQAMARNITLMIPRESALLKQHYRYGYELEAAGMIRSSDLADRRKYLMGEHQKHSEAVVQLIGALKENDYMSQLYDLRQRGAEVK